MRHSLHSSPTVDARRHDGEPAGSTSNSRRRKSLLRIACLLAAADLSELRAIRRLELAR